MNYNKPILHVSISYQGNPASKRQLKRQLSAYVKRQDRWSPYSIICVDSLDSHEEKKIQQGIQYDAVVTNEITRTLTSTKQIYIVAITLISLTLKRIYEGYSNSKNENWMLISFNPSKDIANTYNIQWSLGL